MTDEELREKTISLICSYEDELSDGFQYYGNDTTLDRLTNDILTLIKEAGRKSGEEIFTESRESFLAGFNCGLKEKREPK